MGELNNTDITIHTRSYYSGPVVLTWVRMVHNPTGVAVEDTVTSVMRLMLKRRLRQELKHKVSAHMRIRGDR